MFKTKVCVRIIIKRTLKTDQRPIISCKRKEYNFWGGGTRRPLDQIKLASKGWHNHRSKGDYFIIHTCDEPPDIKTKFSETGITKILTENLRKMGMEQCSEIQQNAIPILLEGKNAVIAAETGCGKTLAFLLPCIQHILNLKKNKREEKFNTPLGLILTPGRELAHQIEGVAKQLVEGLDITTDVIVGGGTKKKMLNPQFKHVDMLFGTLGALSKLTTTGIYKMDALRHVVLDEADTLLDESFAEKLGVFLKKIPLHKTQIILSSATLLTNLPSNISEIINPYNLEILQTNRVHHYLNIPQRFLRLTKTLRPSVLLELAKNDQKKNHPLIVFANTSQTSDWVSLFLNENGVPCVNLNGDMPLHMRANKYTLFRSGEVNVLSCTDVAARGLDTLNARHVINFDFPKYTSDYVHRCGRVGRLGGHENTHVTNFVCGYHEIELCQQMEMAVRTNAALPNVDGNVAGIIRNNIMRQIQ